MRLTREELLGMAAAFRELAATHAPDLAGLGAICAHLADGPEIASIAKLDLQPGDTVALTLPEKGRPYSSDELWNVTRWLRSVIPAECKAIVLTPGATLTKISGEPDALGDGWCGGSDAGP